MKEYYLKGMYETCEYADECNKTTCGMNNDICQGCNAYAQKLPINKNQNKIVWQMVIDGKAIAINKDGCLLIGEAAKDFTPRGTWKICYLNRNATYYLVDGEVKRDIE